MSTTTTSQINTNPITHQPPPNNPIQFISLISRNDKPLYIKLILDKDVKGIENSITNSAVEQKILERLIVKAESYGVDPSLKFGQNVQSKVKPEVIAKLYKDWIIPLTKKVEIDYLLRRLEDEDVELVEKYKK